LIGGATAKIGNRAFHRAGETETALVVADQFLLFSDPGTRFVTVVIARLDLRALTAPFAKQNVFPYEDWIPDELERLSFFAMLYVERARDLVRLWLTTRDKPENFVYAVGFLYRHAIELELKATIAWSDWFRSLTSREQRTTLWGHGLKELWKTAKPLVEHLVTELLKHDQQPFFCDP
jgi:hypothetical protein